MALLPQLTPSPVLREKWGWFVVIGAILMVMGAIALVNLLAATVASIYFIGVLMLIGGGAEMAQAFQVDAWGDKIWWGLGSLLYCAAGVLALANPLLASSVLTLFLAISLAIVGVFRIMIAFGMKGEKGWGWALTSALFTLALGVLILVGWPVDSLWVIGLFLSIDLMMQGWAATLLGLAVRSLPPQR